MIALRMVALTYEELEERCRDLEHQLDVAKRVAAEANAAVREANALVAEARDGCRRLNSLAPVQYVDGRVEYLAPGQQDSRCATIGMLGKAIALTYPNVPLMTAARAAVLLESVDKQITELRQPAGPTPSQMRAIMGEAIATAFPESARRLRP